MRAWLCQVSAPRTEEGSRDLPEAGRKADLWPRMDQPCSRAPWDLAEVLTDDSIIAPDIVGTEIAEVTHVDDHMAVVSG